MKRLEIIHLRLGAGCPKDLISDIRRSATVHSATTDLRIYRQAGVAADLSIHIHHESTGELPSPLGLLLASALREHGMVEHRVWIEEQPEPDPVQEIES